MWNELKRILLIYVCYILTLKWDKYICSQQGVR